MNWLPRLKRKAWAIKISSYTAIYDACVLYPAPLRDLLLELATSGLFRAKWTDEIHDEWIRNVLANRPNLTLEKLTRTRHLMDIAVLDARVRDYEAVISELSLPDPNDRHVLAAAVVSGANAIITFNTKDFPASALQPFNIEAKHPDDFIVRQFGLDASKVVLAAQSCRARLKNPTMSVGEYLTCLERQSLPQTVAELRPYSTVL